MITRIAAAISLTLIFIVSQPVAMYIHEAEVAESKYKASPERLVSFEEIKPFDCYPDKSISFLVQLFEPNGDTGVVSFQDMSTLLGEFEAECVTAIGKHYHLYEVRVLTDEGARGRKYDSNNYFTHIMVPAFQAKVFKKRG